MLMIEYIDSNSGERCLRRRSVNIPLASSDERSLAEVSAGSYRRTSVSVRLTGAAHSHGLLFFVKIIICKNKKILAMECVHCKDFLMIYFARTSFMASRTATSSGEMLKSSCAFSMMRASCVDFGKGKVSFSRQ